MTTQKQSEVHDPQMVGNQFVNQYYNMLHRDPSQAYKFYQNSSVLGRPGPDRQMKSARNIKEINDLILSFDMRSYKVEISFADAQSSYENGVVVLVIGSLIGNDNVRRNFTQSFFLAPENGRFYVLNDVFRFVDEVDETANANEDAKAAYVDEDAATANLNPDSEPIPQPKTPAVNKTRSWAEASEIDEELGHPLENGKTLVGENKAAAVNHIADTTSRKDSQPVAEEPAPNIQLDASKKSYASVLHGLKKSFPPFVSVVRPQPSKPTAVPSRPAEALAAPEVSAPVRKTYASNPNNIQEKKNDLAVQNTSIFVANLPTDATEELLSATFMKFGSIKPNGIQVRSSKLNGTCYGFVEFESASAVQTAVKASPITIGHRQANVEEKRSTNGAGRVNRVGYRDDNGYRNDDFRGRGNLIGGRNFVRNERSEPSSGQGRGSGGAQNGDAGRKVYQNGAGRAARQFQTQN